MSAKASPRPIEPGCPWDGEAGITLLASLEAGATGAMTGGCCPDGIRQITGAFAAGRHAQAAAAYARWRGRSMTGTANAASPPAWR